MSHILIVDDEPSVRLLVGHLLLAQGHRVTEAANGREAVKAFQTGQVDLVVLDILMPEMDGIQTLQALQRISPQVRVVAMSSGGMMDSPLYLRIAELMGATQVLEKPFDADQLHRAVNSALAGRSQKTRDEPAAGGSQDHASD